jgi:pantothenate kinase
MAVEHIAAPELALWIRHRASGFGRYLVGITGSPGSGKSTLAAGLVAELGAVAVPMDGFHLANETLDAQGLRSVKGAPETFAATAFVAAMRQLAAADTDVHLPDFDRVADEPRPGRITVRPSDDIVIVEGNYLLLDEAPWSELRDHFDAVAHLRVDPAQRVERLVRRHVRFGKTRDEASAFVQSSDEPNAVRVEAVRGRAHVHVDAN